VLPRQLNESSEALARRIAGLAPLAVQAMKQILQQSASGSVDKELAMELATQCLNSEDLQEGFSAKREKREPRFKGK
jgi:enoyl-CoA hydratase/carnithine racemase